MKRFIVSLLCLLLALPSYGQDEYPEGYVKALSPLPKAQTWEAMPPLTPEQIEKIPHDKSTHVKYFGAQWCQPCQKVKAELAKLKEQGVKVHEFDADENEDVFRYHKIKSVPTVLICSKGKVVEKIEGLTTASAIQDKLSQLEDDSDDNADDSDDDSDNPSDDELDRLDGETPKEVDYAL